MTEAMQWLAIGGACLFSTLLFLASIDIQADKNNAPLKGCQFAFEPNGLSLHVQRSVGENTYYIYCLDKENQYKLIARSSYVWVD